MKRNCPGEFKEVSISLGESDGEKTSRIYALQHGGKNQTGALKALIRQTTSSLSGGKFEKCGMLGTDLL